GLSDFPMEITPTVSNFIRHKLIAYAKGQEKAKRLQEASGTAAPSSVQQAQKAISDIKQQLGKRA
ncbi:ATP-dependent helicase, partial [Enterobacter hormaechei]|nr:ATP-dependent helicase [Enterobacter hormaechei]